jgi:hypothetical protein
MYIGSIPELSHGNFSRGFNVKLERKDIFNQTKESDSIYDINNDDVRVVNFATSKI